MASDAGGNPGSYFQTSIDVYSSSTSRGVHVFYEDPSAVYFPAEQGEILSLDYAEDSMALLGEQQSGPAFMQNGNVFFCCRFWSIRPTGPLSSSSVCRPATSSL